MKKIRLNGKKSNISENPRALTSYRSTSSNGAYSLIKSTSSLYYRNTYLKRGIAYIKSICMMCSSGNFIVAVVRGEEVASTSRVAKALNIDTPLISNPDEVLEKAGYPCGGVPAFGYKAIFLVDPKVMEREFIYTGGGSPYSLTKISTKVLQQINNGQVVRIRK
jgi:Cys-tRNA(Pro)/Cys-tRNA(Cys) deacylase